MPKPSPDSYPEYFQKYIDQVKEEDLITAFKNQSLPAEAFLQTIPEELSLRRYAEGKWSVREVLQHIIDAERVFAYRAMCFARGEQKVLPSFDENLYAANSHADARNWKDIISEFAATRRSTEFLFNSFTDEMLNKAGKASNYTTTPAALGFITVGHMNHHLRIIQERYLGV
ncbi:MAG TPA: DinB family protein [Chitinophagaceae bacterium]|nr:DinB family protein [Chitinophagaceae bacterium]